MVMSSQKRNKIQIIIKPQRNDRKDYKMTAININKNNFHNVVSVAKNTEIPLFVYCYSGARSRQATGMLQRMGYSKVNNIGGIAAYSGKVEK